MVSGYQHNNLTAPHLDISGAHAQPNKTTAVSQMLMFLNMSAQLQCLGMTCFWLPTANHEKTHRVSVILFSTQPSSRDTDAITLVSSISTIILYRYSQSSWGDESQTDMSMTDIHIRISIYVVRYVAIWKLCFRQYDTSGYLQFLFPVRFIFGEHSCYFRYWSLLLNCKINEYVPTQHTNEAFSTCKQVGNIFQYCTAVESVASANNFIG